MDIQANRAYPTPFVNSTLFPALLLSLSTQKHTPDITNQFDGEYDYIVVGAGAAGSVVASRLSELPCVSVLLLEAGKSPPIVTEVPGIARSFFFSDLDWAYITTPQRHTGNGLVNRQIIWPSGKALGGSTVINGNHYVRGNRHNYDGWASEGATGWSYEEVLPYFKKLEDYQDPAWVNNGYHSRGGPVTVTRPRYTAEITNPIIEAALSLGYRFIDPNGPTQTGFSMHQATIRRGQRCSTAKAYLVPAENRTNLDIVTMAMVTKVVIENNQAVGVQFDHDGMSYEVRARREVIVSAGTTNTAQLLMLSGIGPKCELELHNIPVVADLPVGLNLQDHVCTLQPFTLNDNIQPLIEKLADPIYIAAYIQNRTGPLASNEGVLMQAYLNNCELIPDVDFPDHQIFFLEGSTSFVRTQTGIRPEVYNQVFGPYQDKPLFLCLAQILHPKSRGKVTLQSNDPYDPPVIDPNYFDDPQDIEDVVQGMKACHKIATSPPLRHVSSGAFNTLYPGCEDVADDEDAYFTCQARSMVLTTSHMVGTSRMGDPRDSRTVVDPQLRVKGIKSLRIVDASVMPTIPFGNTMIPTIMVAEKASDMIKETIQCHKFGKPSDKTCY